MDSELFTVGGVNMKSLGKTSLPEDITQITTQHVQFAQIKLMRTWRWVGKALYWLLIVGTIAMFIVLVLPQGIAWWREATKSDFSQKEGLQYLGASTNVTRDDTGWPSTLTPDEQYYLAQQTAVTAEAQKATFMVPREHMSAAKVETPEEKLLKQQNK